MFHIPVVRCLPHLKSACSSPRLLPLVLLALASQVPLSAQPIPAPDMPTQSVAELEALRRASSIDRNSIAQLKSQLDLTQQKLDQAQRDLAELQKDLDLSRQATAAALAAQSAAAQALPDAQASQLEIQTLRGQVAQLETQRDDDRKHAAEEIASLAAQLAKAKETARSLTEANRSLSEARGSEENALRGTIESLQQKAAELSTALDKGKAERDELRTRGSESDKGLETQAATIAELTQLNEKLGNDKKALEQQVSKVRTALERSTGDLADLKARQVADGTLAQRQAEQLETLTRENEKLAGELKRATADAESRQVEIARLSPLAAQQPALQQELDTVKARLAEADKALENQAGSVAELTQLNEQLKADKASLQQQLAAQATQSSTLAADLASAQREAAALRAEAARVPSLLQDNNALNARLRQVQTTLDQIANNARILTASPGAAPAPGTYAPSRPGSISVPNLAAQPAPAETRPAQPAPRYHTVAEGDSLSRISLLYYGSATRWQEIYEANRALLRGENSLRPGQRLRIP